MTSSFELRNVSRRFGATPALDRVTLAAPAGCVLGLVGRNGSGKTTLLHHVCGLLLPEEGRCTTLGRDTRELGAEELGRIGVVHQENRVLGWMRVRQQLAFVASFHERWDRDLERRLLAELELDASARISTLSPGNRQKLALLLAACPRPRLLLLDEPVSSLDPMAREELLSFLLELVREGETTVVISSHVLRDVERVVDRVACLDFGSLVVDAELDTLKETFVEWRVTSSNGGLPARFDEPWVLHQEVERHQAVLAVVAPQADRGRFEERHHALVSERSLNLERIFPLLLLGRPR